MNIAVITGASCGMGREFVLKAAKEMPDLDEIWVIARNEQRLKALQKETSAVLKILPVDICNDRELETLKEQMTVIRPDIRLLVNSAGYGIMGDFLSLDEKDCAGIMNLNCGALAAVTSICLPYMKRESQIFMLASASAFVPQPGFSVYAASKACVLSLSRALHTELKKKGICVTAVCPGPVDTGFLERAGGKEQMKPLKRHFLLKPEKVVNTAWKAGKRKKAVCVPGFFMKGFFILCKIVPHGVLLKIMEKM